MTGQRQGMPTFAGILIIAGAVLAVALNLAYTTWAVNTSQHRWCATIGLLNSADAHQPAPSTQFGRNLVADFNHLYTNLGCG
jgi:hypothetical protein